jgi:RNA polymerase sigma-70 factor (ECF subfamily)
VSLPDDEDATRRALARAQGGDLAAFAGLVRAHQSRVRWQLRRMTHGDDALADDLAQETFVQAWRHLAAFDGRARFATWLHTIAAREFLQHRRRAADATAHVAPAMPGAAWGDLEPPAGDAPPDPSHDPGPGDLLRLDVERALGHLSEAQALCVVHCFHLDLTHEEAADVLGLPVGTVKSHLNRARAKLRQSLDAWAEDAP